MEVINMTLLYRDIFSLEETPEYTIERRFLGTRTYYNNEKVNMFKRHDGSLMFIRDDSDEEFERLYNETKSHIK